MSQLGEGSIKLYSNFEKAYKLIIESSKYKELNLNEECDPLKLRKDKIVDEMIKYFAELEVPVELPPFPSIENQEDGKEFISNSGTMG